MPLSAKEIKEILTVLEQSGWDRAEVTIDDVTLSVSRNGATVQTARPAAPPAADSGAAPSPPAQPSPEASPESAPSTAGSPLPPSGHTVASPSVGLFWRSSEPGATPFVEVGQAVEVGQTLCIVEVMKLMQHVVADVAGTVSGVLVENGDSVEFGTPLFTIEPAAA
jgi:acetyl-CoA carboxylase biotin carboxyl carrier protein